MADQLGHRRENMAEREQLSSARNALVRWDQARAIARKRIDELQAVIDECERRTADSDRQRQRLNERMKTIIAPKEAEAVQSELSSLDVQQSEVIERELTAMEEQTRLEAELAELGAQEESLRADYLAADAALNAAVADIDAELARIDKRREALRPDVDAAILSRYDRLRKQHVIAAAALSGSRCEGCHLDLSAAEVDTVKATAKATGVTDCPECGRLIVI